MAIITSGNNATGTLGTTDSITISTRGSAKFECPTGTVVAEFTGTRTFGAYDNQPYKITALTGDLYYEVADGSVSSIVTASSDGGLSAGGSYLGTTGAVAVFAPSQYGAVSGGSDATSAIQAAIDAASAAYNATTGCRAKVVFPAVVYGITGLLLKPNVILDFGQAYFKKLADGSSVATNSMLRTVDSLVGGSTYYGNYDNIDIIGGTFDTNGFTCPAQIIRLENVRDLRIEKTKVVHSAACQSWAFQIGGKRIECVDLKVSGGTALFQDGIHLTHGDQITVRGGYVESGDDAIACGVDAAGTETWDDEALTNVTIDGVRVKAEKGTLKVYYGRNTTTNMPFSGSNRGKVRGVTIRGVVGSLGRLANGGIYVVDTTQIPLTGALVAATSATMTSNFTGTTGTYLVTFSDGTVRSTTLTNGSATFNWTGAVTASALVYAGDPSRIQDINFIGCNLDIGSSSNDGANSSGVYVQYATNVRVSTCALRITDTASGSKFSAANVKLGVGIHFSDVTWPVMPAGAGVQFFNCINTSMRGCTTVGNAGSGRGSVEITGSSDVKLIANEILDVASSGTGVIWQSVGSGVYGNTAVISDNVFRKASGATTTRAVGAQSSTAGFIVSLNLHDNDLRGQSNSTAIDQMYNSTGFVPDMFFCADNRAAVTDNTPYPITYAASVTLPAVFGVPMSVTMTGNMTIVMPTASGLQAGQRMRLNCIQDGTGGRTITLPASSVVKQTNGTFNSGSAAGASTVSQLEFEYRGNGVWTLNGSNTWV